MTKTIIANTELTNSVAVFDAGIGSYSAVRTLRERFPKLDILYFADRASFPYGEKTVPQLKAIIENTLHYLVSKGAVGIVVASNVPSVTVLDELKESVPVPVVGIVPPIQQAIAGAGSGHVAVLGARSMIDSVELKDFIKREAGDKTSQVGAYNASPLIDLVESGAFLTEKAKTGAAVQQFMEGILKKNPDLRSVTLSSTHLPWLLPFFLDAFPDCSYYDPIDEIVDKIAPAVSDGRGRTAALVSGNTKYPAREFLPILKRLGIDIPTELV
jgi:glutamate racemase